jgi:hypothetical protein
MNSEKKWNHSLEQSRTVYEIYKINLENSQPHKSGKTELQGKKNSWHDKIFLKMINFYYNKDMLKEKKETLGGKNKEL